jgi:O-succinylbenzoate synthase
VKFRSISVHLLTLELRVPFTTSFGTSKVMTRPFVVAETVDGERGLGEVPSLNEPGYKAESDSQSVLTSLEKWVLPSVARAQAGNGELASIEGLRDSYKWIKGAGFAKSGVEAAMWDIIAQREQKPLWQLWGGTQTSFPVGVSIGGKTIEQTLELAANAVSLGYKRLKVKIWPGFDVQVARALRERYPDILLQVDANSAFDRSNWQRFKEMDDLDLLLIEQPLYDDDIVFHSEISHEIKTPVCLDESIHSLHDAEAAVLLWQRNDALDRLIINIKPPRVGGFAEAIAVAKFCQSVGVRTWVGGMLDTAWGKAFNVNFNSLDAIQLPGDHFSPTGAYFMEDIAGPALKAEDGVFTLGNDVSAGVKVDWDIFNRLGEVVYAQTFA